MLVGSLDILAEYRQALERCPVTDEQRDGLNKVLADAVTRVQERHAAADQFEERLQQLRETILTSTDPDG